MRTSPESADHPSKDRGFTLTELLVVVGMVLVLAWTLVPAHAAGRVKTQSIRCMDNLRELMAAVLIYTGDNHDFFPPNPDDGNTTPGHNWCPGQAGASYPLGTGGGQQQFNPDVLENPYLCLITRYINTNAALFRCPADTRVGLYTGTDPAKRGKQVPAARSIAMNGAVGTICTGFDFATSHSGRPTNSVNGPWLNNMHSHRRNSPWRTYGKVSETLIPGPAKLWVLIEEDVYSMNDALFAFGMNTSEWIDWPATRHAMASTLAFADGRVELHKWVDPRTEVIRGNVSRKAVPNSADWLWLSERTSARAQ